MRTIETELEFYHQKLIVQDTLRTNKLLKTECLENIK